MKVWLRRLLIGFASVLVIFGLSVWMVARSWRREFDDEVRRQEQSGAAIHASQLAPPPIPDQENAALPIADAGHLLTGLENGEGPDWDSLSEEEGLDLEPIKVYIEKRKAALEKLADALRRPRCRFPVDYSKGFLAELPHVTSLIGFTRMLNARAVLSFRAGDPAAALRDLRLTLRLSECLAGEPLLTSQVVRYLIYDRAFEILRMDLLNPSPEEWRELAKAFEAQSFGGEFARAFEMERASTIDLCRDYYFKGKEGEGAAKIPVWSWVLRIFAAKAATHHLRMMERAVDLARHPYPKAKAGELAFRREFQSDPRWEGILTSLLMPALQSAHEREARAEAQQQMAAAFCRIKASGHIPESLELIDASTGSPFDYKRGDGGFELRSRGPGQHSDEQEDALVLRTRKK